MFLFIDEELFLIRFLENVAVGSNQSRDFVLKLIVFAKTRKDTYFLEVQANCTLEQKSNIHRS